MIVDYLKNLPNYAAVLPKYEQYEELLSKVENLSIGSHPINETDVINVMEVDSLPIEEGQFEFHRDYLDIQIVLTGEEYVKWQNIAELEPAVDYDPTKDIGFLEGEGETLRIKAGMFYIVYPEDAHMPGRFVDQSINYKKAVVKIKV